MKLSGSLRKLGHQIEEVSDAATRSSHSILRNVAWISAGLTALVVGVAVGREIRQRYKFSRRTPYDVYAHAGDKVHDVGVGV